MENKDISVFSFVAKKFYYFAATASLGLIAWAVPHWGETNFPPLLSPVRYLIIGLFANWLLSYILFVSDARIGSESVSGWIWMGILAIFLSLTPAVFSVDIMEYLIRGRILGIYHANPYTSVPMEFQGDILEPGKMFFRFGLDSYGPLSVYLQTLPALMFQNSIRGMVWAYKMMDTAFLFGACLFFWKIVHNLKLPNAARIWAVFAYCPLLIVTTLIDGHNDILMMAFSVISIYFLLRNQFSRAFFFWTCGFLIKYMIVLQLPFMILLAIKIKWRQQKSFPWMFMLGQAALNIFLVAACFAPLWAGTKTFSVILHQTGTFYTNTIPYLLYQALHFLGLPIQQQLLKFFMLGSFVLFYGYLVSRTWRLSDQDPTAFFRIVSLVYLAFYAVLPSPVGYWYLSWALFCIILAQWPNTLFLVLLYSIAGMFSFYKRFNFLFALAFVLYGASLIPVIRRGRAVSQERGSFD